MAGLILQYLFLVNYAFVLSRGYRYNPHLSYSEEDSYEYTHDYHEPRPVSRIDQFDETIRHQRTSAGTQQRSIPFTSDVQRVQEQERRRLKSQVVETARAENGSYKIVNHPKPNQTSRRGPGVTTKAQDNVLFPGPTQGPLQNHKTPLIPVEVPEKCKLEGICEDLPDYPQELVDRLLSKVDSTRRFNIDELQPAEIAQRFGGGPEEVELCSFRERLIVPRAAPDSQGKWYLIANQKDKPVQSFRVEICNPSQKSCSEHAQFASGYEAFCKQKYTLRRMAAIGENDQIVEHPFSLPTCCSCVLKPWYPSVPEY